MTPARSDMLFEEERYEEESRAADKKYTLAVTNCPKLTSITCGQYAFELYSVLTVESKCVFLGLIGRLYGLGETGHRRRVLSDGDEVLAEGF